MRLNEKMKDIREYKKVTLSELAEHTAVPLVMMKRGKPHYI